MKHRALPQSFWQEPCRVAHLRPPGSAHFRLPPLGLEAACTSAVVPDGGGDDGDHLEGGSDLFPDLIVALPDNGPSGSALDRIDPPRGEVGTTGRVAAWSNCRHPLVASCSTSEADTDLLFSLFNSVTEEEAQRRVHIVRRGR